MSRTDGRRIDEWMDDLAGMRASARGAELRWPLPATRRRADAEIAADINQALASDPELQSSRITVAVASGMVTLEGDVATRFCKHWAARVVDRCHGVMDVRNRLRVREDGPAPMIA